MREAKDIRENPGVAELRKLCRSFTGVAGTKGS